MKKWKVHLTIDATAWVDGPDDWSISDASDAARDAVALADPVGSGVTIELDSVDDIEAMLLSDGEG
jgi:hypothetical protein